MKDIEFYCMSENFDLINFSVDRLGRNLDAVAVHFYSEQNEKSQLIDVTKEDIRKLVEWLEEFLKESDKNNAEQI